MTSISFFSKIANFLHAFHFHSDQNIEFSSIFERKFFHERGNKTSHNHSFGLIFIYSMRHEVKQGIFIDISDTGLMSNKRATVCDFYIGYGIGSRLFIEYKSIAINLCDGSCCRFFDIKQPTIGINPSSFREAFRHNFRFCIFSYMYHFGSSIGILIRICKGNTKMHGLRIVSLEYRTRIEHSNTRSKVSADPFYSAAFLDNCSFCIEIIGVYRPVFYARVAHFCVFSDIYFYTTSMKARGIIFWGAAPFYILRLTSIF